MLRTLLLFTVVALFAAETSMSDLSRELMSEGLIWTNDDGIPTTTCAMSLENGPSISTNCTIIEGFGPRSVGCYSVWSSAGIIRQGCYSGQVISLRDQCRKAECVASRNQNTVHFCCCHGALCNAKYSVA